MTMNTTVENYVHKLNEYHKKVTDYHEVQNAIKELQDVFRYDKIIAFSGSSTVIKADIQDNELSEQIKLYSEWVLKKIIYEIMRRLRDYKVAILTWWTKRWVPKIATEIAKELGFPTIWVYPTRWEKYSLDDNLLNLQISVPSIYWESERWDESNVFAKIADAIVLLWWWAGTLIEYAHVMKMNEWLINNGKEPKKIAPVTWIQWVWDMLSYIPVNDEVKRKTLPQISLLNWEEVFERLKIHVDLEDNFKDPEFLYYLNQYIKTNM